MRLSPSFYYYYEGRSGEIWLQCRAPMPLQQCQLHALGVWWDCSHSASKHVRPLDRC